MLELAAVDRLAHGVQVQRQRLSVVRPVVPQPRGRVGQDDAAACGESRRARTSEAATKRPGR